MGNTQWIGPYEVLGRLGEGGMGVVLSVRRANYPKPMALKLLPRGRATERMVTRFLREGRVLAKIRHPNVVAVLDGGEAQQGWYLVTEQVPGLSLAERVAEGGPLDPIKAVQIARELTDALGAVHAVGVVHRDLKPENVILRPDGTPVLIDFGIVKDPSEQTLTVSGALVGTLAFMAPEQAGGANRRVDPSTDVYGLGALLYACLTGNPPFTGESPVDIARQIVADEPAWPASIPGGLVAVLRRALAKDQDDRFSSMTEFADALDGWLAGGLDRQRGLPALVVGAGAALGVLALVVALTVGGGGEGEPAADAGPGPAPAPAPAPADPPAAPSPALDSELAGFQRTAHLRLRWRGGSTLGRLPGGVSILVGLPKHGLILAQASAQGPWLIDARSGRVVETLEGWSTSVSANEEFVVTLQQGKRITRYRTASGEESGSMRLEHNVGRLALSADGEQLLVEIHLPNRGGKGLQLHAFGDPAPRAAVHLGESREFMNEIGFSPVRGVPYATFGSRYVEWDSKLQPVYEIPADPSLLGVRLLPDERLLFSDRLSGVSVQARGSERRVIEGLRGVKAMLGSRAIVADGEQHHVVDLETNKTLASWEFKGSRASFLGEDAVVFGKNCLQVIDVGARRLRWDLGQGHLSSVDQVTWTSTGRVRSLAMDGYVCEWKAGVESGRAFHPNIVDNAVARIVGDLVYLQEQDAGRVYRWDGSDTLGDPWAEVPRVVEVDGSLRTRGLRFYGVPNGELATFVSSNPKELLVRDLAQGVDHGSLPIEFHVSAQAYWANPPLLAVAGDRGRVEVWDLRTKQRVSAHRVERTMVKSVRFIDGEGLGLLVGTRDLTWVDPWGKQPKRVLLDTKGYLSVEVSFNSRWLLLHGGSGVGGGTNARLYSMPGFKELEELDLSSARDWVTAAEFSPDGSQLAVGTARGTVICFDLVPVEGD